MIDLLKGRIYELSPTKTKVLVGSVGYSVNISLQTSTDLKPFWEEKRSVTLEIYHKITEANQTLYGFFTRREREAFRLLIKTQGVGGSTALAVLSTFSVEELANIVNTKDVKTLTSAKGIGAKTAQKILMEMEGRFDDYKEGVVTSIPLLDEEAAKALVTLGVCTGIKEARKKVAMCDSSLSTEEIIKKCLKK